MPRGALTIAGHLNIAFLEALSRAVRSPAPIVPEDMLFGFGVRGVIYPHGFLRPVSEAPPAPFERSNSEHLDDVRGVLGRDWRNRRDSTPTCPWQDDLYWSIGVARGSSFLLHV